MTKNRDLGLCYVLARVLEGLGCKCLVVTNNNYCSIQMRMWCPDAIFYVTMGRTAHIRSKYPNAKLFLCSGEGSEGADFTDELKMIDDPLLYDQIEKSYLWGQNAWDCLKKRIAQVGPDNYLFDRDDLLRKKFVIHGNPRADLVRYAPNKGGSGGRVSVGLIGHNKTFAAKPF